MTCYRRTLLLAFVLSALGVAAPGRAALTAREVLIVANAGAEDSVELAKLYAKRRGIDVKQILLLRMSGGTDISRENYDAQLVEPIREALKQRGLDEQIRCICTIYGVPYRVRGPADDPEAVMLRNVTRDASKMHYQIAIDYQLLDTVAVKFPEPRTEGIKPLGLLFAKSMEAPSEPLPKIKALHEDIDKLLAIKQAQVAKIAEADHRKIARRQLMALHFELHGLKGLIDHIRQSRPEGEVYAKELQKQLDEANGKLAAMRLRQLTPADLTAVVTNMRLAGGLLTTGAYLEQLRERTKKARLVRNSIASVDSELALLHWAKYSLRGPANNPLNWRARLPAGAKVVRTLMVSRLDGPSRADVTRMIENAGKVEKTGLAGALYVDAGGPSNLALKARTMYDAKLNALARFAREHSTMKVVLNTGPAVFGKDACPNAALYVGWYSLRKYVNAFTWNPGAVGWHVASWEAVNLRDPKSNEWCVKMIQNGVAATLGAVREPLLRAFPEPAELMKMLMTGQYTLAECYWRTIPHTSWQMLLLGDPLYNPFKARPQVKVKNLPAGLAP